MPAKKQDEQGDAPVAGAEELQQQADEATEKGYVGQKVDQTPDSAYTLQGQAQTQATEDKG